MSFASEPGRDDGNLPPVNVVIPDDARELDRDVLAYRREMRAQRRRQRLAWLVRPFSRPGSGGPAAIVPLIAACLALSLVGGALLSVITMTPASEPARPQASAPLVVPRNLTTLPAGSVQELNGRVLALSSLVSSAIAIVPANCGCGPSLQRLAEQADAARVYVYFAGDGQPIPQLAALTRQYGDDTAVALVDLEGVLATTYHPAGLTVLFVFHDASVEVRRDLTGNFKLGPTLNELEFAGRSLTARKTAGQPTAAR